MKTLLQAVRLFLLLTLMTGVIYPLCVTFLAQKMFPFQANGSLIEKDAAVLGSVLIAQKFQAQDHFWGRPSAVNWATMPAGASNQGPTSALLIQSVTDREQQLRLSNQISHDGPIPSEMVFASASGIDPHISPAAAKLQVKRVAAARNIAPKRLIELIDKVTEPPQFGIAGESRVNVLHLNLALDSL